MLNLLKDTYILEMNYSQYELNGNLIPRVNFCVLADYGENKESIYLEAESILELINQLEKTKTTKKIIVRNLNSQAGKMLLNTLIDLEKKFVEAEEVKEKLKEQKKLEPDKNKRKRIRYNYKDGDMTILNFGNNISEIKYYFGNDDTDTSKKKTLTKIVFVGVDNSVSYNFSKENFQPLKDENEKVSEIEKQETYERLFKLKETLDFNKSVAGKHWSKSIGNQVSKLWQSSQDKSFNTFYQLTLKNKVFLDWEQYSGVRNAYKGGLVYAKESMLDVDFSGVSLDMNRAFGEAMLKADIPWNHCFEYNEKVNNEHFKKYCDCFSILEIELLTDTKVKRKCIPFLVKNEPDPFKKREFDTKAPQNLPAGAVLTYTKQEIDLALETYEDFNFKVITKFCFEKTKGIFDETINKLCDMRKKGDPIADKYSKACIVNLYSLFARSIFFTETKFMTNGDTEVELTNKCFGSQAEVVIKEIEKTFQQKRKLTSTSYFPIATAISSYVRIKLVKAVNLNYDKVHYANTDGILMETKEIPKFVLEPNDISQSEIGKWKIDAVFEKARILAINQWCSWNKIDGKWKVEKSAISGLAKEQQKNVMPKDYQYGKVIGTFKKYNNEYVGYVLYESDLIVHRKGAIITRKDVADWYYKNDKTKKEIFEEKKQIRIEKYNILDELQFDKMLETADNVDMEKLKLKNDVLAKKRESDVIDFSNIDDWRKFMKLDENLKPIDEKEIKEEKQLRIWGLEYYDKKEK